MSGKFSVKKSVTDIDFTLHRVFHQTNFRPYQREIIGAALDGHDVYVQAATSFGKSLCFQLPAVIGHQITIVISPLIALMHNQVAALSEAGIAVATINSATPMTDKKNIMNDLCCGHPKTRLLYITPELVLQQSFRKVLETIYDHGELGRIAIDEAHCISEWGHDFRPAYRHLSFFRQTFPKVPIMCLTATATSSVRTDILKTLGLVQSQTKIFTVSTVRPNLHYRIEYTQDDNNERFDWLLNFIKGIHKRRANDVARMSEISTEPNENRQRPDAVSGIIYVSFRSDCEALASRLRNHQIGAAPYHAGMNTLERSTCQEKWLCNSPGYDIIVATTAFGMGIDKKDVRFVVHWTVPKSFEGFYQEAGRAGRDGKAALCVLFYSREERDRVANRIAKDCAQSNHQANAGPNSYSHAGNTAGSNVTASDRHKSLTARLSSFQELVKFCEQTEICRHALIGKFFGESQVPLCDRSCDVCFVRSDGEPSLVRRKMEGLSSEEWVSTQREQDGFFDDL